MPIDVFVGRRHHGAPHSLRAMASSIGHFVAGTTVAEVFQSRLQVRRWRVVLGVMAVIPDIDLLAGVIHRPYDALVHRTASHSISAGLLAGVVVGTIVLGGPDRKAALPASVATVLAYISHALIDAATSYGDGVALYWPFALTRVVLPWRPIGEIGSLADMSAPAIALALVANETLLVVMPCLLLIAVARRYVRACS